MYSINHNFINKTYIIFEKLATVTLPVCTRTENGYIIQKRFKKKAAKNRVENTDRALQYFDAVYPTIYGEKWNRMKRALLEDAKYVAVINNFTDNAEIIKTFEELCAFDVGAFYSKSIKHFKEDNENTENKFSHEESVPEMEESTRERIRPSLVKLTEDEKAALAELTIDNYPAIYKQRVAETSEVDEISDESSRVIKASHHSGSLSHGHIPSTKLKGLDDWVEESDVFRSSQDSAEEIGVKIIRDKEPIKWPENLKIFSFVKGQEECEFPSPKPSAVVRKFTHYLMNGASILPVLILDVELKDRVLDVCSGPGGKSLALLQTLKLGSLFCNDKSQSRVNRVHDVFTQYIPKELDTIWNTINYSAVDGTALEEPNSFDKVLVDAPCLNDRLSLQQSENSIFKTTRTKERMFMPELQANLILNALKSTKRGGCVVYSTCTLSPLQNDGAVHLALTKVWRETEMICSVIDVTPTMKNLTFMYNIGHHLRLRYGHIVLPVISNNCGPMYVCKIIRDR